MSGITDAILYSPKAQAIKARSYSYHVPASNGTTFAPQSIVRLDLPTGRPGTYLNQEQSYLRFKVKNNSSALVSFDKHASCVIQRLEIYHASNLLESIDNYNVLYSAFLDLQVGDEMRSNGMSIAGGSVSDALGREIAANGGTATVCIPLMSGVIGTACSKWLPLCMMSAADARLELTVAPLYAMKQADGTVVAANWEITDLEYVMQIVELDSQAQRMIDQATGGVVTISSESWKNFNTTFESASIATTLIPAKHSSLKTIYGIFRTSANSVSQTAGSVSARYTPAEGFEYNFRIGSLNVPQQRVRGHEEAWFELLKSLHAVTSTNMVGSIDRSTWVPGGAGYSAATPRRFFIGQDTESFSNKNDVLEAGISTLGSNLYMDMTWTPPGTQIRFDAYSHFDQFIQIAGGVATVRF